MFSKILNKWNMTSDDQHRKKDDFGPSEITDDGGEGLCLCQDVPPSLPLNQEEESGLCSTKKKLKSLPARIMHIGHSMSNRSRKHRPLLISLTFGIHATPSK